MKKNSEKNIFPTAIVEKRNLLNEVRKNNMGLQELRFFSIYLSMINPYDVSTRVVRFPLCDFQKIMGIGEDINMTHFRMVIKTLLQQVVEVPNESGNGYSAFQIFKECRLDKDESGEWFVEIDAHDKALPLMFEFKERYFTYQLWNALNLKSVSQIRMYEILKQYENIGRREISVQDLRELLYISKNSHPRWDNFRERVIDSCQKALAEKTDIRFTYERGKAGAGGKWLTVVFYIFRNKDFVSPLGLEEFISKLKEIKAKKTRFIVPDDEDPNVKEKLIFLSDACNDEFSFEEIRLIACILSSMNFPGDYEAKKTAQYHYLNKRYIDFNIKAKEKDITKRFSYFKTIIENDMEKEKLRSGESCH